MKSSEFFKKVLSWKLWANLFAMALVVVAACFGVKYGIDLYTHHGERIRVPNIRHKSFADAEHILDQLGLEIQISDTGYVKVLPPDCILEQSLLPGTTVKSGRIVYVVINAANTPTLTIPDVIDNSSYREAEAKLMALGFKLLPPKRILGERDWVYGILSRGRRVNTGDKVSIESPLTLLIGNGRYGDDEDISYTDPEFVYPEEQLDGGIDEFEEVGSPATQSEVEEVEEY